MLPFKVHDIAKTPSKSEDELFPEHRTENSLPDIPTGPKKTGHLENRHENGGERPSFMDLRASDVRQKVRVLPASVTKTHVILCKYYPNCSYGTKCLYIHLTSKQPREYDSYVPPRS